VSWHRGKKDKNRQKNENGTASWASRNADLWDGRNCNTLHAIKHFYVSLP
jgi:hypothetical protein